MSHDSNPFASPAEIVDGPPVAALAGERNVIPYASARPRAKWAVVMLAACMAARMLSAIATWLQLGLLGRIGLGMFTDEEIQQNDARMVLLAILILAVVIGSGVTFLMWFHRVHRNLPSLGTYTPVYSPGWAVGAWFVPILNLFRPYQIMVEVWKGSDPATIQGNRWTSTALVGWWWTLWIIVNVVGQVCNAVGRSANTLDLLVVSSWLELASDLLILPAALLAIAVVRRVTANQEERFYLLTGGTPLTPDGFPATVPTPW